MVRFIDFLMVGLGGAAGSMLRYGVTLLCSAISFQCCGGALNLSGNVATFIATVTVCVFMAWLGYRLGQSR